MSFELKEVPPFTIEEVDASVLQSDENQDVIKYRTWFSSIAYIFGFVVLLSTYTLLITVSSNGAGNYDFFFTTVTLSGELLKLFISCALYVLNWKTIDTPLLLTVKKSLHFSIPAALYCANNNLLFLILIFIDPSTFQLLSNVNIIFIALFTVLLIRVQLNVVHWISMIMLLVGTMLTQLECDAKFTSSKIMALLFIVLYGLFDALSSVYTERRLKFDVEDNIHAQNIHIFMYGTLANTILFFIYDFKHTLHSGFFYGYSWFTAVIIIAFALAGIFGNFIMKEQSTISRAFCISISMLLTTLMAYMFLGFHPSMLFGASVIIVICSIVLYRYENILGIPSNLHHEKLYEQRARVTMTENIVYEDTEDPLIVAAINYDNRAVEAGIQRKED